MDFETLQLMDDKFRQCRNDSCSSDKDIKTLVCKKLDKSLFFWIVGISTPVIFAILASLLGILYGRITTLENKNNEVYLNMATRLTAIEVNTANTAKQVEQLQKFFANFDIKETK